MLLDTHVLLWSMNEPERLGPDALAAFRNDVTDVVVSVASLWEIAIKRALGQLHAPENLPELIIGMGHEILDVCARHAWHVRTLPPHHRDPFDRILIAQAQVEGLVLVTHDRQLQKYDVGIIQA